MPEKELFVTVDVTEVKTAIQGDVEGVGVLRWKGDKLYRWVKNIESTAMVAGQPVMHDVSVGLTMHESVVDSVTAAAADVAFYAGVVMGAIPTLGFGWILVDGIYEDAIVDEPGSTVIAIGDILIPSATIDALQRAVAIGSSATYPRHAVAMEEITTTTPATASTTTINVLVKAR